VSRYQKGKTNLDFTGARDSEWQWHQLGHMQICTSLQTDYHASTPPLSFLQRQSTEGIHNYKYIFIWHKAATRYVQRGKHTTTQTQTV